MNSFSVYKIHFILVISCCLLLAGTFSAKAQSADDKDKRLLTIRDEQTFSVHFTDSSAKQTLKVNIRYESETDKYTMILNADSLLKLKADTSNYKDNELLYEVLKDKMNTVMKAWNLEKGDTVKGRSISDVSSMEIFRWIYYVRHTYDIPATSGILYINEQVMVLKDVSMEKEYSLFDKRMRAVKEQINKSSALKAEMDVINSSTANLKTEVDKRANERKEFLKVAQKTLFDTITHLEKMIADKRKEIDTKVKEVDAKAKEAANKAAIATGTAAEKAKREANADTASANVQQLSIVSDTIKLLEALDNTVKIDTTEINKKNIIILDKEVKSIGNSVDLIVKLTQNKYFQEFFTTYKIDTNSLIDLRDSIKAFSYFVIYIESRKSDLYLDTLGGQYKRLKELRYSGADTLFIKDYNARQKFLKDKKAEVDSAVKQWAGYGIYTITKLSLQFESGFLERIQVYITIDDVEQIFENNFAIGFSSINNYKALKNIPLFERNSDETYPYILLGDVISYDNKLGNYTRDYSPADTTINDLKASVQLLPLKQDHLVNLLDAKIYSDIAGLTGSSPNGLVQVDVQKKFNLYTVRKRAGGRSNWGRFNYLTIFAAYTKIEKDQKYLPLRNDLRVSNNTLTSPYYVSNLDLRQYETANIGFDLNALVYDIPEAKSTFTLDLGARYGDTRLADTAISITNGVASFDPTQVRILDAHTITFYPRLSFDFFSQRRIGFTFKYQFNKTFLFSNNEFKQILSYKKSPTSELALERNVRNFHMFEMFFKVDAGGDNQTKYFLRTRFFMQQGDVNTFFTQFQLGLSYNLFYKK